MKILMATMALDIGGAETHIVELSKELKSMGHDVMIASGGGVYVKEIEEAGIRHFNVPMNRRNAALMAKSCIELIRIIRREKPDIVHAHARIPGFLCGIVKKLVPFHLVTTAHWVFDTSGLQGKLTNWGEKTVAVSEDIKTYLMSNYGTPADTIFVTINGIDTDKFSPEISSAEIKKELGIPESSFVIGHVSRLDESRALAAKRLIDSALRLDKAIPGMTLLIVGGGDSFDELSSKAREINARVGREAVVMTGPRTDINLMCAASDVFVGVSRAALEAMSAEKPVILAGNEGYLGLFTEEKLNISVATNFCCRDCEETSEDSLICDISGVFSLSENERKKLGTFGRELIKRDYSTKRMAGDTLRAYNAALYGKKITMSGYYGFGNAGDEAVLKSIIGSVNRVFADPAVTVLSAAPESTERVYGCSAVKRFSPGKVIKAIRGCDIFISGGGSLMQDATSTRSLVYYVLLIRLAKFFGKKIILYANGIGPVNKPANRRRVRKAVNAADCVTLRDSASEEELRAMGVTRSDIAVTSDPVFLLNPAPREVGESILREAGVPEGQFVAVSIRKWGEDAEFQRRMAEICDGITKNLDCRIVFLPMQPRVDERESEAVAALMSEKSWIIPTGHTAEELMSVIAQSELTLSMRLHSLVFAARAAVPSIGFSYDPKLDAFLDILGEPNAGRVESIDVDHTLKLCLETMHNRRERAAALEMRREELINAARETERYLAEL